MKEWWKEASTWILTGEEVPGYIKTFARKMRSRTLPVFRFMEKRKREWCQGKRCMLCDEGVEETLEHLFTQCEGTRLERQEIGRKMEEALPSEVRRVEELDYRTRSRSRRRGRKKEEDGS